ncbi:MAG TPA: hypothetical protein PKY59_20765, partial [Pyrinomonadaceae bacterium]|nr:hypothetical protein [Pyrinomonadaceae bacterium]
PKHFDERPKHFDERPKHFDERPKHFHFAKMFRTLLFMQSFGFAPKPSKLKRFECKMFRVQTLV